MDEAKSVKPGYKTTEFWLMLLAVVLGAVVASGLLEETWAKLAAVGVSVLGSFGYTAARTKVKTAAKMLLPIGLAFALSACGSWQKTTRASLYSIHKAGVAAHDVVKTVCKPALEQCKAEKVNPCAKLVVCQEKRRPVLKSFDSLQRAVAIGLTAIELADKSTVQEKIAEALQALRSIRVGLATWGVTL